MKQNTLQYKIQPGKIEHYTPGKSSVSDKEAKQVTQWSHPMAKIILTSLVNFPPNIDKHEKLLEDID